MNASTVVRHPFSNTEIIIQVPQFTRGGGSRNDSRARFAFEIDPQGVYGHEDRPLLKIVRTSATHGRDKQPVVEIGVAENAYLDYLRASLRGERAPALLAFWEVWEVSDMNDIPPQGSAIIPGRGWRRLTALPRRPPITETVAMAAFDSAVSFIPVVGDIVDIAEFVYGAIAGVDRWGRRVKTGDLVIMGIGALLPFVGAAALRGGRTVVRRFGARGETAQSLVEDLRRAGLSGEDLRVIRQAEGHIRAGRHVPPDLLAGYSNLIARIRRDYPVAQDFLNARGTGFIHADLQRHYQRYRQWYRQQNPGMEPAGPVEWTRLTRRREAREILQVLLGPDFARRASRARRSRHVNLADVPRPQGYTDQMVRQHLQELNRHAEQVLDRLGSLRRERSTGDALTQYTARRRVNEGHFRILKGNIAEVLSLPIQRAVLRRVNSQQRSARIIRGVRARLMEDGRLSQSLLFSDNIIAYERGGNLYVRGVFEVKSGYQGGQEATMQIFEWLERRLTDGSQLVIPRGAKLMAADGTERVVRRARAFTYDPTSRGRGRVILLFSADRHLITARGAGHLGMDSAMRVATDVHRRELSLTSEQVDFLTANVLQSL
jgi:hypothetical protein